MNFWRNFSVFQRRARKKRGPDALRPLVDPVLCALGWDVSNPEQVRPMGQEIPDYAPFWEGKPFIMVEVKALHATLNPAKDKGFAHCWKNKVPYFVIADGERWEVRKDGRGGGGRGQIFGEFGTTCAGAPRPAGIRPPLCVLSFTRRSKALRKPSQTSKISIAALSAKMKSGEIPRRSKPPAMLPFPGGKNLMLTMQAPEKCLGKRIFLVQTSFKVTV